MASSMTGFGSSKKIFNRKEINVEIKSVNGKFCDVKINMKTRSGSFEIPIMKKIKSKFARGTFKVYINIEKIKTADSHFDLDLDLLKAYKKAYEFVADELELKSDLDAKDIMTLPQVIEFKNETDNLNFEELETVIDEAINELDISRKEEGKFLVADIEKRIKLISSETSKIKKYDKGRIVNYKEKLEKRIAKLSDKFVADDDRLEREIAIYCDRIDITEEIIRINSHLKEFKKQLKKKGSIGKTLDFRTQELLREFNTISNKCNDSDISNSSIIVKGELEKIREQIQNIE